jgi:hypothetical protein
MKYDYATEQQLMKDIDEAEREAFLMGELKGDIEAGIKNAGKARLASIQEALRGLLVRTEGCIQENAKATEFMRRRAAQQKEAHAAEENRAAVADIGPAHY